MVLEYTDGEGKTDYKTIADLMGKHKEQCRNVYKGIRQAHARAWRRSGVFSAEDKEIIRNRVEEARVKGTSSADLVLSPPFWKEVGLELGGRDPKAVRYHWANVMCDKQLPTW